MKALNSYALRVCALRCAVQLSWTDLGWMGGRDKILLDSNSSFNRRTLTLVNIYDQPHRRLSIARAFLSLVTGGHYFRLLYTLARLPRQHLDQSSFQV